MFQDRLENYYDDVKKSFEDMGIHKEDIVYVSSDIMQLLKSAKKVLGVKTLAERNMFLNKLIDTLQELVTEDGTLLFPMYNWDYCKGITYSPVTTKSKVGVLNNFVLEQRREFKRTKHPIYSFMVWGKDAQLLCQMDNQEAFGGNSPFRYLNEMRNSKQLALGINLSKSVTYTHYVEQLMRVPYRFHKFFFGKYETEKRLSEFRVYSQYVRNLDYDYEYVMQDSLFQVAESSYKASKIHEWKAITIDFMDVHRIIENDIRGGAKGIYEFKEIEHSDIMKHILENEIVYEIKDLSGGEIKRDYV